MLNSVTRRRILKTECYPIMEYIRKDDYEYRLDILKDSGNQNDKGSSSKESVRVCR